MTAATVDVIDMANYEPAPEIREIPGIVAAHNDTIHFIAGVDLQPDNPKRAELIEKVAKSIYRTPRR